MSVAYLHGVETINVDSGIRPINVVRSAVIALIGVAPEFPANTLKLVLSDADAAEFGPQLPGFTIPQALAAIRANKGGVIMVVNVFDPITNTAAEAMEPQTLVAGKLKLDYAPLGVVSIFDSAGAAIVAVKDVDYKLDEFGNFTNLSTTFVDSTIYKFSYTRFDPNTVTTAQIIGGETTTERTGLKVFKTAYNEFGFKPKIFVAPGFSSLAAVAAAMHAEVGQYRAMDIIDAPNGTTPTVALAGRGPSGTIPFNTSSIRAILGYPNVQAYDAYSNADQVRPLSAYFAGVMARVDNEEGYHVSPSNHEILGITKMERPITWDISDKDGTMEATLLNGAGITTMATAFGMGIRLWGNRTAAFPSDTAIHNFISVQRTRDVVEDSIELGMLPFIDKPISLPQIDSIVESVNSFLRTLISRGALLDGSVCTFDPTKNSETELALGHITFTVTMCPPPPMERITFLSSLDITLLRNILSAQ